MNPAKTSGRIPAIRLSHKICATGLTGIANTAAMFDLANNTQTLTLKSRRAV